MSLLSKVSCLVLNFLWIHAVSEHANGFVQIQQVGLVLRNFCVLLKHLLRGAVKGQLDKDILPSGRRNVLQLQLQSCNAQSQSSR